MQQRIVVSGTLAATSVYRLGRDTTWQEAAPPRRSLREWRQESLQSEPSVARGNLYSKMKKPRRKRKRRNGKTERKVEKDAEEVKEEKKN